MYSIDFMNDQEGMKIFVRVLEVEGVIDTKTKAYIERELYFYEADNKKEHLAAALGRIGLEYTASADYARKIDFEAITGIIKAECPDMVNSYKVTKFNRSGIESMIGRWYPPSKGQMKVGQAVEDIIYRIRYGANGITEYYSGRPDTADKKGKFIYRLIIRGKIKIFIDENQRICYRINA